MSGFATTLDNWLSTPTTQPRMTLGLIMTANGSMSLQLDSATLAVNDRLLLSMASASLGGAVSNPTDEEEMVSTFLQQVGRLTTVRTRDLIPCAESLVSSKPERRWQLWPSR